MELLGIIIIFIFSPLETFLKIGNAGTGSKLIGGIIFYFFILNILRNKKMFVPKEGYLLLLFVFIGIASSSWATYPEVALNRSSTLIQIFILYIITFNLFKYNQSKLTSSTYDIFIIFGTLLSLYTIGKVLTMGSISAWTRVSISEQVDVNHLASFLMIPFLLGIDYSISKSIKYFVPTLIILTSILLTQSRGAVLVILFSVAIYLITSFKRDGIKLKYILGILGSMFFIYNFIPKEFLFRLSLMFTDKDVLIRGSGRNFIWRQAWQLFKSRPIIGVGLGNFTSLYRPPHSSFFQIISELGILGLVTMSLFIYFLFHKRPKDRKNKLSIEYIIVIALLIMSLTVDIFYQKYLWIMIAICSSKKYLDNENKRESL